MSERLGCFNARGCACVAANSEPRGALRLVPVIGLLLFAFLLSVAGGMACGQESAVTESDPGQLGLKKLYAEADTVALVEVLAGDNESYRIPLYKARVVRSFKGTTGGTTLYFGPYIGIRVGVQYFVFLKQAREPLVPTSVKLTGYGPVSYWEVEHEGYGSMSSSYECVFDVKDSTQQCDYGVRVCTNFVALPHSTEVFPPMNVNTMFGCRWTRKKLFLNLLDQLASR